MVALTPEKIEELRRSGIRLDREGRMWHKDAQVTHLRFQSALRRWLDTLPDGRTILRLDELRYAYVDVDDAHLLVTSVQWVGDAAFLTLNDETSEELVYSSLWQGPDSALYCRVRGEKLTARFLTPAYYRLAEHIEECTKECSAGSRAEDAVAVEECAQDEHAQDETFALRAKGQLYPIASSDGC